MAAVLRKYCMHLYHILIFMRNCITIVVYTFEKKMLWSYVDCRDANEVKSDKQSTIRRIHRNNHFFPSFDLSSFHAPKISNPQIIITKIWKINTFRNQIVYQPESISCSVFFVFLSLFFFVNFVVRVYFVQIHRK